MAQKHRIEINKDFRNLVDTYNELVTFIKYNCEWYYHWALALYTGMRNGELYALRWDHIDLDANQIHVKSNWNNVDGFKSTKSGDESPPLSKENPA